MPIVSSVAAQAATNTVTITGTGFQISSGFSGNVSFAGIAADSVTVDSDTQLTVVFASGIPLS